MGYNLFSSLTGIDLSFTSYIFQNSPDSDDNQVSSSSNASNGSTGSTVNASKPVVPPIPSTSTANQLKCSICGKVTNNRFHERQCRRQQEIQQRKAQEEARLERESRRSYFAIRGWQEKSINNLTFSLPKFSPDFMRIENHDRWSLFFRTFEILIPLWESCLFAWRRIRRLLQPVPLFEQSVAS